MNCTAELGFDYVSTDTYCRPRFFPTYFSSKNYSYSWSNKIVILVINSFAIVYNRPSKLWMDTLDTMDEYRLLKDIYEFILFQMLFNLNFKLNNCFMRNQIMLSWNNYNFWALERDADNLHAIVSFFFSYFIISFFHYLIHPSLLSIYNLLSGC